MDNILAKTIWMPMRDEIYLHGKLYCPKGIIGEMPVVIMRNPYNGLGIVEIWDNICIDLAKYGYIVINQDVRGTGKSEGSFNPFFQEGEDGYDTVEWVASQPWSNKKVGLWGVSYLGVCVMQAAIMRPPHLVAGAVDFSASDYHDHWVYDNGVFNTEFANTWASGFNFEKKYRIENGVGPLKKPPIYQSNDENYLPAFYKEWLEHPEYDDYWSTIDIENKYNQIDIPINFKGGWFDAFANGTIRNFLGIKSQGRNLAKENSRLTMYPSCHQPWNSDTIIFPNNVDYTPYMDADWWDEKLKNKRREEEISSVKVYVMSPPKSGHEDEGFWIKANSYSLNDRNFVKYSFTSDGTRQGNLSRERASTSGHLSYYVNSDNPVKTLGGSIITLDPNIIAGIVDQSSNRDREDIISYISAPFEKDIAIYGSVNCNFCACSNSAEAYFNIKFCIVREDGSILNYLDRIVSSKLPENSKKKLSNADASKPLKYKVNLGETAIIIRSGMRLQIEISSTNYPRFELDKSDGMQIIYNDEENTSWLEIYEVEPEILHGMKCNKA